MNTISSVVVRSIADDIHRVFVAIAEGALISPKIYFSIVIIGLFLFIPPFLSRYYLHILILIFMFAAASESWNIIGGYGGQFSLGHAAYFGIGAYTSTLLYYYFGISPWVGLILGGVIAMLVGKGIGLLCFRMRGPFFVIATIALTEVLRFLFLNQRWITMGAAGISIQYKGNAPLYFQFHGKLPYYYVALAMTAIVVYITYKIENSRLGQYLTALGQNQDAAEAVGVNSVQVKQVALSISAFFTALTGTFYAQYAFFIDPDTVFGLALSIEFSLFAIIGGIGTLWGPIIGAFILRLLVESTSAMFGGGLAGMQLIIYGGILLIVVMVKPEGLAPIFEKSYLRLVSILPGSKTDETT